MYNLGTSSRPLKGCEAGLRGVHMSYTALYRSWRPQTFSQLVGQEHISRTLKNALAQGKVAHGYIFCGPRGTGKTSTARILAKSINCHAPQGGEPCNQCPSCRRINDGASMDVIEIDAASNRGIDEMRDLREKVRLAPAQERFKVYIIDEVHMLTTEAFNAFLKTLEEPPQHVIFVLATTEPHKVPATILSRCQRFDFRRLGFGAIRSRLKDVALASGVKVTDGALKVLARAAGGSLRDGLSMLDQCLAYVGGGSGEVLDEKQVTEVLGMLDEERLLALGQALAEGDGARVLEVLDEAAEAGKDPRQMAKDIVSYFRFLLQLNLTDKRRGGSPGAFREQARLFTPDRIIAIMRSVSAAESEMRWSAQPQVILEVALTACCRPSPEMGTQGESLELFNRIRDLEKRVEALERLLARSGRRQDGGDKAGGPPGERAETQAKPKARAATGTVPAPPPAMIGREETAAAASGSVVSAEPTAAAPRDAATAVAAWPLAAAEDETEAEAQTGAEAAAYPLAGAYQLPQGVEDLRSKWPELIAILEQDAKLRRGLIAILEGSEPLDYSPDLCRIGYRGGGALAEKWLEDKDFHLAWRQAWSRVWGEKTVPKQFAFERLAEASAPSLRPLRSGASQRNLEDIWLEEAQRIFGGTIVSWPPKGWKPAEKP